MGWYELHTIPHVKQLHHKVNKHIVTCNDAKAYYFGFGCVKYLICAYTSALKGRVQCFSMQVVINKTCLLLNPEKSC